MGKKVIQTERAEAEFDRLNPEIIAMIKGMLERGDKQSDIAAFFLTNSGRISEINTGTRHANIAMAPPRALPPPGPYSSAYELWKMNGQESFRIHGALQRAKTAIDDALSVTSIKAKRK